ncbi:MAG: helix-turn-helix domain-containing protein [Gammaproteobacteria bacterium]|nr:helix-turn-helix domain-containing protein [Gammaproteobacteria bacterium]
MAPALGELRIRPSKGVRFQAKLDIFRLKHLCLFTVHANSLNVQKRPPHDFIGVNVPVGQPFLAKVDRNYEEFSTHKAHFLNPRNELVLDCSANFSLLACTFSLEGALDYARKILQSDDMPRSMQSADFSLLSPSGVALQRSLAKAWSHLHSIGESDIQCAISELEDDLMTRVVLLNESQTAERAKQRPIYLRNAEEYLCANLQGDVTRDALCDAVGAPLRTLSWAFRKYHATGPMGFLKQRRLEAAYRDLSRTEPKAKSVTDVALDYSFSHMGKFAIEYKQAFGESPSVTLARTKR